MAEAFNTSNNPVRAFWDFYGLYFIWWKLEGWRTSYKTGVITNEARIKYVREAFLKASVQQADYLLQGLSRFIADEFGNLYDEYLVEPSEVKEWGNDNITLYQKILRLAPSDSQFVSSYMKLDPDDQVSTGEKFWAVVKVPDVIRIFNAPFWRGKSDLYGGPPWAQITERFGKLLEAFKRKSLNDLAMQIDQTYDLDHNTGSISSKFPKNKRVDTAVLDQRHDIPDIASFIPLVSPSVAAMINGVLSVREAVTPVQFSDLRECFATLEPVGVSKIRLEEILEIG